MRRTLKTLLFMMLAGVVFAQSEVNQTPDTLLANQYIRQAQNLPLENPEKMILAQKAWEIYQDYPLSPRRLQAKGLYAYALYQLDGSAANDLAREVVEEARSDWQTDVHPYLADAYLAMIKYQRDYRLDNGLALELGRRIEPYVSGPSLNYFELKYHVGRCFAQEADKEAIAARIRDMETGLAQVTGDDYDRYKVLYHHLSMFYHNYYTDHHGKMVAHGEQAFPLIGENDYFHQNLIAVELVKAYGELEELEEAEKWLEVIYANEPRTVFKTKELEAIFYEDMSEACFLAGEFEKGLAYSQKNIDILLANPDAYAPMLSNAYFERAKILYFHVGVDTAVATLKTALSYEKVAVTRLQLGMWLGFSYDDRYDEAITHFQLAMQARFPHFQPDNLLDNPPPHAFTTSPLDASDMLYHKGMILYKKYVTSSQLTKDEQTDILKSAYEAILLGLELRERGMREFQGYEENLFRYSHRTNLILGYARQILYGLYELNPTDALFDEMFEYTERRKVFQLIESLTPSNLPPAIVEREEAFVEKIQLIQQKLLTVGEDSLAYYRQELFAVQQAFDAHKLAVRKDYPKEVEHFYDIPYATPADIQATLDDETLYLSYDVQYFGVFGDWINMTAINKNGKKIIQAPQDSILRHIWDLEKLNKNPLLIQKKNREQFIYLCHQLYRILIEPFAEELQGINKLVIVQEGHMLRVPFELLLPTDELKPFHELDYFIRDYDISYQYSGTFYLQMKHKSSVGGGSLLAFAPVFTGDETIAANTRAAEFLVDSLYRSVEDDHFVPLPNTRGEVMKIASYFPTQDKVTLLLEKEATKENLLRALQKPHQIVHIATHGLANFDEYRLSGLACYEDLGQNETLLFANEIQLQDIRADLVVLSSCESGAGMVIRGEGLIAINRSFFYAGAKNVLFSLWKVNDQYTSNLMIDFYKNYFEKKDYSAALRQAKLNLIADPVTANPRYWAPFVLIGE